MSGTFPRRMAVAAAVLVMVVNLVAAGEILSTMRNVNAVPEAHGFQVIPATDVTVAPLPSDHSPGQAFEIFRPDGRPVTIGRLFTSCTCIQLQAHKRTFAAGERAILQLRNIRPTPPEGAVYAIFVQITSPVRTTLRFDTFVQSLPPEAMTAAAAAPAPDLAANADQPAAAPATPPAAVPAATPATPPPTGVNPDLAAQILDAVETEIQDGRPADAGTVRPDDGTENPEVAGELRDELEAMLDRELAVRRVDAASATPIDGTGEIRELGTADLAVDLNDGLPDFYAATPNPAPAATADATVADDPAPVPTADSLRPPAPEVTFDPAPATDFAAAAPIAVPAPEAAAAATPEAAPVVAAAPVAATSEAYAMPATTPEPAVTAASASAPEQGTAVPRPPKRDPNARKPVQAVSLITVGVRDMPASIRFYEALGWHRAARGKYDQTAFFQLQGQILALYPIADLLREQNMVGRTPAPGGITLALHVQDKADVWSVYQRFIDAGGMSLREPAEMASGAVSSYVADPDGNAWEISWVPQFRIDEDGGLWLP
ncbi:MAG: VOC family protein [Planctomycetaceae bacterium]|nr:VOC family protein [Planctomycetaceae bacterium]